MTQALPDALLDAFSHFVETHVGLHFPRERWPELTRGARAATTELGFADVQEGLRTLVRAPITFAQRDMLARHLTVGETYFFRDPGVFAALQEQILPALAVARRGIEPRLRLWSAGCSTGEEAYTLAMVVRSVLPDIAGWEITILGTDINPHALRKAEDGVYHEWSFRNVPAEIKKHYFRPHRDGGYEILPEIRKMVTFSCLNLVEDAYPSLLNDTNAMDVVFCRNVLMYFTANLARAVVRKLGSSLVPGGWLALGAGDMFAIEQAGFETVDLGTSQFLRKREMSDAQAGMSAEGGRRRRKAAGPYPPEEVALRDAESSYEAGRYQDAAARLSALTHGERASPAVFRLLAQSLANQGKLAEALMWCEREARINPADTECLYLKATVLLELGDAPEAAKTLKQVLQSNPGFVPAYVALGNLDRREGRLATAHCHYREALRMLARLRRDALVPGADGITAGRLSETISLLMEVERTA